MKKSIFILLMLFSGIVCYSQIADEGTYLKTLKTELLVQWPNNRTINLVFHGHSVPSGYFATPVVNTLAAYPHQTLALVKETYTSAVVNSITTSIGGEQSEQGATRFDKEVLCMRPDVLFIDYGLNDRGISLARSRAAWESMVQKALAYGCKVILLTPTPDITEDILNDSAPLAKQAIQIRAIASKYHVGLVDSYAVFKKMRQNGETLNKYMAQSNHINELGHKIVAAEIYKWFAPNYVDSGTLCDFENAEKVTSNFGATASIVDNPLKSGLDTTNKCLQIGRTSSNWYELVDIPVSFIIPAGKAREVHILVKYMSKPDIAIRVNTSQTDIRPLSAYTDYGNWQDITFMVNNSGTSDLPVTQLRFLGDIGYNNSPAGKILSGTTFGYIDEIRLFIPEEITANSILDFEDKSDTEAKTIITTQSSTYSLDYYCANPSDTSLNKTARCLYFESPVKLTDTGNWWHGAQIAFKKPVSVNEDRKYLHVMMMKDSIDEGTVHVADVSNTYISTKITDKWTDYVSSAIPASTINSLYFKMNSGANVKCYIDEVWIDNNPNPRVYSTGIAKEKLHGIKLYGVKGGIQIDSDYDIILPLFDLSGKFIQNIGVKKGSNTIHVASGLYLLNHTKIIVS